MEDALNPPAQPETSETPSAPIETPQPPLSVADIPGLGPIRIRALQKAEWTNLKKLRGASVEVLCATVPGMTGVKAQYILDYLAQFPNLSAKPPKPPKQESVTTAQPYDVEPSPLLRLCVDALYRIAMLYDSLLEEEARPKLLREMKQIASNVDIIAYSKTLTSEETERAEGCLLGICQQIDDSRKHKLSRKTQGELVENLAPYSLILADLI